MTPEFKEWPKIARLRRNIIITEKIDGTNAQIHIEKSDEPGGVYSGVLAVEGEPKCSYMNIYAGSRNRWLEVEGRGNDNFGFAKWVASNGKELLSLGEGTHYGEWYGNGIQRGYGLPNKRFALFNVGRWTLDEGQAKLKPACCEVVPILYNGPFSDDAVEDALATLRLFGSKVVPFNNPEGIIVYLTQARAMYKVTLDNDAEPKTIRSEASVTRKEVE